MAILLFLCIVVQLWGAFVHCGAIVGCICALWCKCIECISGNSFIHVSCRSLFVISAMKTRCTFLRQSVCHKGSAPSAKPMAQPPAKDAAKPNPQARWLPSLQQVSPLQWPLLGMISSSKSEKVVHGAYWAIDLSTHSNVFFHGHFVHAMPLFCAFLVLCCAFCAFLEIPGRGGGVGKLSLLAILAMFPWGCRGRVARQWCKSQAVGGVTLRTVH